MSGIKTNAIVESGSPYATFFQSDSAGTTSGTLGVLPIIKSSVFRDNTDEVEKEDEGGNVYSLTGKRKREFEAVFMQQDKETLELLVKTYRNGYMSICKEITQQDVDGGILYLIMPKAKAVSNLELSAPGGEVTARWTVEALSSALTVDLSDYANSVFTKTLTGTVSVGTEGYLFTQVS